MREWGGCWLPRNSLSKKTFHPACSSDGLTESLLRTFLDPHHDVEYKFLGYPSGLSIF